MKKHSGIIAIALIVVSTQSVFAGAIKRGDDNVKSTTKTEVDIASTTALILDHPSAQGLLVALYEHSRIVSDIVADLATLDTTTLSDDTRAALANALSLLNSTLRDSSAQLAAAGYTDTANALNASLTQLVVYAASIQAKDPTFYDLIKIQQPARSSDWNL